MSAWESVAQKMRVLPGCSGRDHEGYQMLLARVGLAGGGGVGPLGQQLVALARLGRDGLLQPCVKGLRDFARVAEEAPQIVVAHAAADDQHALVTQGRERAA